MGRHCDYSVTERDNNGEGERVTKRVDVIALGLGAMGSAAAYHLARRGHRVLGLDRFERGHTYGSSHGKSRIIRQAYYQAPYYVPMAKRSYELWRELETDSGRSLLTITGGLNIGTADGRMVGGALASARSYGLHHELLSPNELAERFPGFRLSDDLVALYEPEAGYLQPEESVFAQLDLAASHGADLRHGEAARSWSVDGDGVRVETARGSYAADYLVLAAGPWTSKLLQGLDLPLEVVRIVNVHFEPATPERFLPDRCPVHLWLVPEGHFYGFPHIPGQGLKLGRHWGEVVDPDAIRRDAGEAELDPFWRLLTRYMPGSAGKVIETLTCLYTNTPDQDFIIDWHPEHRQVLCCCGFSGHGFKFAPAIGELLADLIERREPHVPTDFMSIDRFLP
jgi:sarcosine oxidase